MLNGTPAFLSALSDTALPCAAVDLSALERNVDTVASMVAGTGRTVRVASKSVRHVGLLRRVLERGGPAFAGLMCYAASEAAFLAERGFDDLLVAYPTLQTRALRSCADAVLRGTTISFSVDSAAHVAALSRTAADAGAELDAIIDVDMSYRPVAGVHLGVRRSPIRSAMDAVALAHDIDRAPGVRLAGVLGYEAQVAGLQDRSPHTRATNGVRRLLKRASMPDVVARRGAVVGALRSAGYDVPLVNGGGSGSVRATAADPVVTEVAVGSAFLCPHLFDHYDGLSLDPALFFALEASRRSDPGVITCAAGGYVASGPPGTDRLPMPWYPAGLRYVSTEGAGEVQTPLFVPDGVRCEPGDAVLFRHAKAGELAERFNDYALVRDGAVESVEPTYRGDGRAFG